MNKPALAQSRTCPICGKKFRAKTEWHKFCSRACRFENYVRERQRPEMLVDELSAKPTARPKWYRVSFLLHADDPVKAMESMLGVKFPTITIKEPK